ncbi:MAG: hypothetical protein L6R39_004921 [Caloplaca ligustica]|nr:MAG: hypothetical protein L6R39_004921 [Caloplaca ligustica]
MSATNAASPVSAAVLAPSLSSKTEKPVAPSPTTSQGPPIFTQKEWVVPPRPKPGRKPAADTPPTKRKVQNREAQRAFRERRAARVGELEGLMKKREEETTTEQAELRAQVHQLKADLHSLNQLLFDWQHRMQELEATVAEEKKLRKIAEIEVATLRNGQEISTDAVPLPSRRYNGHKPHPLAQGPFGEAQALDSDRELPMGCGKCSSGTRCECIEQAFDMDDFGTNTSDAPGKRPHSPPTQVDNKRLRHDSPQETQPNEIDFTSRFSSKKPPNLISGPSSSTSFPTEDTNPDPCGFCHDGTPCICAEMVSDGVKAESRPGMSRIESPNNIKITPSAPSNPCINGAGTCAQCLSDANSTLFCKSLAAMRPGCRLNQPPITRPLDDDSNEELPPTPSSNPDSPANEASTTDAVSGPTLSCADVYETLSRHPAFEKASEELSTWMPQLATVPGGRERTAFEVEAASVMGVLRFFDRRFGRTGGKP